MSVLENLSITWLFSKLIGKEKDPSVNIFSSLNPKQFAVVRSVIVKAVLGTDMSHHFMMVTTINSHQEELFGQDITAWFKPYTINGCTHHPSLDMLVYLLHIADISNPGKPAPMFALWADAILAEFYAQGDREASMGMPISPLCDRATTSKKQSQVGFIKFVVQPAFMCLTDILPEASDVMMPCLQSSLKFWEDYEDDESNG